jgi:NAD(P)H dehydrogenase (quinone)
MKELLPSVQVVIVYYSRFGAVRTLAERIADGVRRVANAEVRVLAVEDQPISEPRPGESPHQMELRRASIVNELGAADALIVGAPAYFGSMASPVKRLFEDCTTAGDPPATDQTRPWRQYHFRDKIGAAFTASATPHGGNEAALHSILTMMMHLGMIVVTPGQGAPILENDAAPYGPTAITGPQGDRIPGAEEQEAARRLGERVAQIATWLKLGRLRAGSLGEWEVVADPPFTRRS